MKVVQLGNGGPPGQATGAPGGWRSIASVLRSCSAAGGGAGCRLRDDFLNLIFPSDCRICGGPLVASSGAQVCEDCVARVAPQTGTLCNRCGDALPLDSVRFVTGMGSGECMLCRLAPPEFSRAVAYAVYDDEVREMLHLLKFNGMRRVADRVLGGPMAAAILMLEPQAAHELIVIPVPLFAARERSRGFNQAHLLASAAIAKVRKQRPAWKLDLQRSTLLRVKDTRSLFALQPHQRRASLRGAFRVDDAAEIKDREVLLIDDIMTTGATARECSRVLLRAGAAKVWVATLARAQAENAAHNDHIARWDATPASPTQAASTQLVDPRPEQRQTFLH